MSRLVDIVEYYEIRSNSDQTESKGHQVGRARFDSEDRAVQAAQTPENIRRWGVMGTQSNQVVRIRIRFLPDHTVTVMEEKVWGYRKGWDGKWGYGFHDNRDAPTDDPDYITFLRLKSRFEAGGS